MLFLPASSPQALYLSCKPDYALITAVDTSALVALLPIAPAAGSPALKALDTKGALSPTTGEGTAAGEATAPADLHEELRPLLECAECPYLSGCVALDLDRDGVVGATDLAHFLGDSS